jgi:hypothetical protein
LTLPIPSPQKWEETLREGIPFFKKYRGWGAFTPYVVISIMNNAVDAVLYYYIPTPGLARSYLYLNSFGGFLHHYFFISGY